MPVSESIPRRKFMAVGASLVAAGAAARSIASPSKADSMSAEQFKEIVDSEFFIEHEGKCITAKLVEVQVVENWRPPAGQFRPESFLLILEPKNATLPADGIYSYRHPLLQRGEMFFSRFGTANRFQTSFS